MRPDLSPSQREAVCCGPEPCEVIAGPGSGKTLVITERILYLLESCKTDPSRILVLTFSRSSAAEMKERFLKISGSYGRGVLFGTFHSVFFHILKESTHREYRLLSQTQKDRLLLRLIERYYPDPYDRPSLEEAEKAVRSAGISGREKMENLHSDYLAYLKENGYVDFDGMILECLHLLRSEKATRDHWRSRFAAILVDEFQDINREQYEILRLLSSGRGLFVVGDDDQSIYGFRGSDPAVMQQFLTDFPDGKRVFLDRNYRCSGCICKAASLLIRENRNRIPKELYAAGPPGDKTVLRSFRDESSELRHLFSELLKLSREELDKTAVIVRTNTQAAQIEKYLSAHGITCRGKIRPGQEIKSAVARDLEAYRLLAEGLGRDLLPRQSLYRVMNRPERFLLRSSVKEEWVSPKGLLTMTKTEGRNDDAVHELLRDLTVLRSLPPEGFVRYLFYSVGYAGWAERGLGSREEVRSILQKILRQSSSFEDLKEMIRTVNNAEETAVQTEQRGVHIMTMHVSKGLEFDRVYLPALNDGIIPGRRCITQADFEEERRLLYVAMTRARRHLELMYTEGTADNLRPPSRFLTVYGVRSFESL